MSEAAREPGEPRSGPRARYAALATLAPLALWHQVAVRRGQAYLLLGLAASPALTVAAHLAGLLAGVAWALRGASLSPWRTPRLLAAFALASGLVLVGSMVAFASPVFVLFAPVAWFVLGLSAGAYAASLARSLRGLAFDRSALLAILHVESLTVVLALLVGYLLGAERVGPLRTGLALAMGCALVAQHGSTMLAPGAAQARRGRWLARSVAFALGAAFVAVEAWTPLREPPAPDPIVLARASGAGRLVMTAGRGAFQLYLDGMLRLSTIDAARRREAMVHPVMQAAGRRGRVLLIGGGDGGALREIVRYPDVTSVTLVEPEPAMVELAARQPVMRAENGGALADRRVQTRTLDPVAFLADDQGVYDVIVVDLLDPEGPRRSKWFTRYFYRQTLARLAPDGVGAVVTSASPLAQRQAFWSVVATIEAAGAHVLPYRADLPTLGPWGHALFAAHPLTTPTARDLPAGLVYVDAGTLDELFALAPDEQRVAADVNLLHHQVLPRYRQ